MPAFRLPSQRGAVKLTVHRPEAEPQSGTRSGPNAKDVVYWRVNGHRAAMLVWTDDEFERLATYERPDDAQRLSCGIWAVLRML